jgi:hypothetical protein
MDAYAYPVIGVMNVDAVKLPHIMQVLEPIWCTKTQTASRLRGRIESVLDWAAARGYRQGPNPAQWRGLLDKLLSAPAKVAKPDHHPALAVSEAGEFMQQVREQPGIGARALEFTVLTAVRSGEALRASWSEIDFDAAVWTIPAGRMKAGREHRVPLSPACIELLRKREEVRLSPLRPNCSSRSSAAPRRSAMRIKLPGARRVSSNSRPPRGLQAPAGEGRRAGRDRSLSVKGRPTAIDPKRKFLSLCQLPPQAIILQRQQRLPATSYVPNTRRKGASRSSSHGGLDSARRGAW